MGAGFWDRFPTPGLKSRSFANNRKKQICDIFVADKY